MLTAPLLWSLTHPCPAGWVERFEETGIELFHHPLVKIEALKDGSAVDEALKELPSYDGVVFTSRHAVRMTSERLEALGLTLSVPVYTVGSSTENEVAALGWRTRKGDHLFSGRGLADWLAGRVASNSRLLFPKSTESRMASWRRLKEKGIHIYGVDLYRPCPITYREGTRMRNLTRGKKAWVAFGSPSAIMGWINAWGSEQKAAGELEPSRVSTLGKTTARALGRLGIRPGIVPQRATAEDLCRALYERVRSEHP